MTMSEYTLPDIKRRRRRRRRRSELKGCIEVLKKESDAVFGKISELLDISISHIEKSEGRFKQL
jgi:hypothetical protein